MIQYFGMILKRYLRKYGYDIKKYHPLFETFIKKYNISTVFDIGANNGQFATKIHKELPKAKIYSFEPLKDCYDILVQNLEKEGIQSKAFNFALGEENGETVIKLNNFSPSSSILPITKEHEKLYPKSKEMNERKIIIRKLDDVAKELEITNDILIKIDVQGFEDKVIKGGSNIISKAKIILVENSFIPLYEGQSLFGDIHKLLSELGFNYSGHGDQHWNEKTGELVYEDSIYTKS